MIAEKSILHTLSKAVKRERWSATRIAAFAALFAVGIGLVIASALFVEFSERASLRTVELFAPALRVISSVSRDAETTIRNAATLLNANEMAERVRLEEESARFWKNRAEALEIENVQLRRQLGVTPEQERAFLTARVIGGPSGPFRLSMVIDAGARDGVVEGATVVSGVSLVGRVIGVGATASRVLLLGDPNSRVPVRVGPLGTRAILTGDGTGRPLLELSSHRPQLTDGARVVTSGTGGVFARDILVGRANATDGRVQLDAGQGDRLLYVRVLLPLPGHQIPDPSLVTNGRRDSRTPARAPDRVHGQALGAQLTHPPSTSDLQ